MVHLQWQWIGQDWLMQMDTYFPDLQNYSLRASWKTEVRAELRIIFGGIAFGTNVFLRCHTDADFTMSISQVFLKGKDAYNLEDDVICYFCFPTLGVAVPLRPGDYFMFNALIPHCISSRCRLEDNVMCASVYLKTAVVGMNNNKLQLTSDQAATIELLHSSKNN